MSFLSVILISYNNFLYLKNKILNMTILKNTRMNLKLELKNFKKGKRLTTVRTSPSYRKIKYSANIYINGKKIGFFERYTYSIEDFKKALLNKLNISI